MRLAVAAPVVTAVVTLAAGAIWARRCGSDRHRHCDGDRCRRTTLRFVRASTIPLATAGASRGARGCCCPPLHC